MNLCLPKGLAKDKIADSRWTISYFKEAMGKMQIDVLDNIKKKCLIGLKILL